MGTHPIFESDFDCLTDVLIRMEVIDLEQPVNSARWGLGEKVDDDEENNNEVLSCGSSPKKSPTKEQKKTVSDAIGNDEIQEWMVHIVDTFNRESMIRFERGEISDKNPISVKGTRDLEDGFVIGLTIRAHCPNLIAPHNITRSSNRHQKLSNWVFLNERVFKIDDQLITDVVNHDKQRLIDFILMLKNLLERQYPQKPVDPSSSNMMLRPLEKIFQIPALISSKRSKRKVSQLKAFHLLEPADQSILLEKEKVLTRHRVCITELESRFRAVQGEIKEQKATIARIEKGDPEDEDCDKPENKKKGCCCTIS